MQLLLPLQLTPIKFHFIYLLLKSYKKYIKLECGPMPNVMAAQPHISCESSVIPFLVPRRLVWLIPATGMPCSNADNIGERKT